MFAFAGKIFAYAKQIFERSLVEPDVNSRLVFLGTSAISALSVLILTIAFVCSKGDTSNYSWMVGAVGGAAVGHGFSRYLTKKDSIDPKDGDKQ